MEFIFIIKLSQMVLTEKDSEITEIETASSGEVARLRATLEEINTCLVQSYGICCMTCWVSTRFPIVEQNLFTYLLLCK